METIRSWGMRVIAVVLVAGSVLVAMVAAQSDWPPLRFVRTPFERSGVAAATFSVFLVCCAVVALIASSRRLSESAQVRLSTGLLIFICIGILAFGYAIGGA